MFPSKKVLFLLVLAIQLSSIANKNLCQVKFNEIKLHDPKNAFIELSITQELDCDWHSVRLVIFNEDFIDPKQFFTISDVIILDNATFNEHGLLTIGQANISHLHHQFNYDKNILHGLALLRKVNLTHSVYMDQLLLSLASNWSKNPDHDPYLVYIGEDLNALNIIKQMLVDFIVHGVAEPELRCGFMTHFDPKKEVYLEFEKTRTYFQNYSISWCFSQNISYHRDGFELILSTPGAPNICNESTLNVNTAYILFQCKETSIDNTQLEDSTTQLEDLDADEECKIFINELNTGSPGTLQNMDFIELFIYCTRKNKKKSLQGYKLIGISAGSGRSDKMLIDLVINLWNSQWNEKMFFTIGTPNVQNTDLTTDSPFVLYRNKYSGRASTSQQFMWTGSAHLHAIALLYKKSYNFPEIQLSAKNPYIMMTDEIRDLIQNNLVDLVVYGRQAPYDNCALFTDLCNDYTMDYVLREFDNTQQGLDRTLNRCTTNNMKAFVPNHFKLGSPTPGATNDCTGAFFIIEPHLANISDPLQQRPFDSTNLDSNLDSMMRDNSAQCTSALDSSTYASTSNEAINEVIDEVRTLAQSDSCSVLNLGANDGNMAEELDISNSRKRRLSDTFDYAMELEWETTKYFE